MATSSHPSSNGSAGENATIAGGEAISPSVLREHAEPQADQVGIPPAIAGIFILIGMLAITYLAANLTGTSSPEISNGAPQGPVDPKILGRRTFAQNCSACHQSTGLGIPRLFPPLAGSEWVVGNKEIGDNHLATIILHGLQGPIDVCGKTYNNAMPPWQHLSDEQIAAVLTFIRSEWGNSSSEMTADFVKSVREQSSRHNSPWSQKDLRCIPPTTRTP